MGTYYNRCEEIENKYDLEDDEQFEIMFDETEKVRKELGIHELEVKVGRLEDELLDALKQITSGGEYRLVAQTLEVSLDELHEDLFEKGTKLLNVRRRLIELALRVA
jgi:hypothetical protein